ncbi:MAG: DUF4965 domain-containing protein [Clostridiales bacterium]|nr:DUF4965 domain-containing protein [Clostridiales bacterium]
MANITRLPAFPLITNDPYFSIWSCSDHPSDSVTRHWAGQRKRLNGAVTIDGVSYRFLGPNDGISMKMEDLTVTPTSTRYLFSAAGISLALCFTSPLLLHDLDTLSTPITFIDFEMKSLDGKAHAAGLRFTLHDDICYEGEIPPHMHGDVYPLGNLQVGYMGQKKQSILCHTGDHITIDWGYAYLAADTGIDFNVSDHCFLTAKKEFTVTETPVSYHVLAGYDDVASINYFGYLAPAWYARNGKQFTEALCDFAARREEIMKACAEMDEKVLAAARKAGGENMAYIAAASYRQTIAAHKLIADRDGNAIFLSKENDSNGCIGTVDVSYPSIPLYLIYNPELVRGMCRPVLKFAHMPCWDYDFAPHDVGRYPYATGQVYAYKNRRGTTNGETYPPLYRYPAGSDLYDFTKQMPVEECGNMLIMLAAIYRADGDLSLAKENMDLLDTWVNYLERFGEDPGDQLCTDDFAGHLARNINLSAKAVNGIASYALLKKGLGDENAYEIYMDKARKMAQNWLERAKVGDYTALTFDGNGWSMKYNLVWDLLFKLDLLPKEFYRQELESYLPRINEYGLPLDSRETYTKSDWIAWVAAMAPDAKIQDALLAPIVKYLKESGSRVPFSDWYDTKSGLYHSFINRTVQGGMFMPMLAKHWEEK